MSKHRALPMSPEDNTTEHTVGDPIYHRACQDLIDESQWSGCAPPCYPEKIIVHHLDAEESARHLYKRD